MTKKHSMKKMFLFLLFLPCLGYCSVSARDTEKACISSNAYIMFTNISEPQQNISVVWKLKRLTGTRYIGSLQQGHLSMSTFYQHKAEIVNTADIALRNVSKSDEGTYVREVSDYRRKTISRRSLLVLVPPSGPPYFDEMLKCTAPAFLGHPVVKIGIKDRYGDKMENLQLTNVNQKFQCCMDGMAIECVAKGIPNCTIYTWGNLNKDSEEKCLFKYVVSSAIYCGVAEVLLLIFFLPARKMVNKKSVYQVSLKVILSGIAFALVVTSLSAVIIFSALHDCVTSRYIVVGVGGAFSFPIFVCLVTTLKGKYKLTANQTCEDQSPKRKTEEAEITTTQKGKDEDEHIAFL